MNELGQAVTSANLIVVSKADALTLHENSLEKIRMLEDNARYGRGEEEEVIVTRPPRFVTQVAGPQDLWEGKRGTILLLLYAVSPARIIPGQGDLQFSAAAVDVPIALGCTALDGRRPY